MTKLQTITEHEADVLATEWGVSISYHHMLLVTKILSARSNSIRQRFQSSFDYIENQLVYFDVDMSEQEKCNTLRQDTPASEILRVALLQEQE